MAEQIANNPAFAQMTTALQESLLGGGAPAPATATAAAGEAGPGGVVVLVRQDERLKRLLAPADATRRHVDAMSWLAQAERQ